MNPGQGNNRLIIDRTALEIIPALIEKIIKSVAISRDFSFLIISCNYNISAKSSDTGKISSILDTDFSTILHRKGGNFWLNLIK